MFLCALLVVAPLCFQSAAVKGAAEAVHSGIKEIVIKVKGMICPFCSNALERALKARPYIKQVKNIDLQAGLVDLLIKDGVTMTQQEMETDLATTIKEATFAYDGVEKVIS